MKRKIKQTFCINGKEIYNVYECSTLEELVKRYESPLYKFVLQSTSQSHKVLIRNFDGNIDTLLLEIVR